jgi:acyl carrier protein
MMACNDAEGTGMTRTDIEDKIKEILKAELEIPAEKLSAIQQDTPLLGRGIGLDSMEVLTLSTEIENTFDFQIDDADLNVSIFKDIGHLADYIQKRLDK